MANLNQTTTTNDDNSFWAMENPEGMKIQGRR